MFQDIRNLDTNRQPSRSLFDHAWNRVRDRQEYDSSAAGDHEARHWHRRAYALVRGLNVPSRISLKFSLYLG